MDNKNALFAWLRIEIIAKQSQKTIKALRVFLMLKSKIPYHYFKNEIPKIQI
jgi:hypothetical protein